MRVRAERLAPYIAALAANVSARGVPTMRPLWWEFPGDPHAVGVNDQYMLGPDLLVAPVTVQGATTRLVTFPGDATTRWVAFWDDNPTPTPAPAPNPNPNPTPTPNPKRAPIPTSNPTPDPSPYS